MCTIFLFSLIKIKTIFLNLAIAFTFIQCLRTVRLYLSLSGPTQTPPLPGPLTCIASRAEDQAQGEEENLWQGSPRSLFSPVPAYEATPPSTSRPAPHLPSSAATMQERRIEIQEENIVVILGSELI